MAEFENKKLEKTNVNQGQEFKNGDGVRATDINALVSGILYNTEKLQTVDNITIIREDDYPNQDGSVTPFPNMSPSVFLAIYQELGKGNAVFYKPFGLEITPVLANTDNIQLLVKNVLYTYSIEGSEVTYTTKDLSSGGSDIDLSKYYEKQNQVLIESGLVQVGNDSDENERPANHTRIEPTGFQTVNWMYNSLARLQSQTYMREGKFENIPSLRLGYTRLIPTDNTVDAYLTLPKKDGTLATLDDVTGGAIIHEDINFPNAITDETFYDIVGNAEKTHIINGHLVCNVFGNTGFNVLYKLPGSYGAYIYDYGVAADSSGLHNATIVTVLTDDNVTDFYQKAIGVLIWDKTVALMGEGTSANYKSDKISIIDNDSGEAVGDLQFPQKTGTFALVEDVDDLVGDIETTLDSIIAIQNSLIGGNA